MSEMRLWMKVVALAPVSSITRFLSAQTQSSVSRSARVHRATLLQSAMCFYQWAVDVAIHMWCQCGAINHKAPSVVVWNAWKKRQEKDYDTWCSQVVSNPSTNQARRGLTSLIRREVVLSSWYGRNSFFFLSLLIIFGLMTRGEWFV